MDHVHRNQKSVIFKYVARAKGGACILLRKIQHESSDFEKTFCNWNYTENIPLSSTKLGPSKLVLSSNNRELI